VDLVRIIDALPGTADLPMVAVQHGRYNDGLNALLGRLLNGGHPVISRPGSKFMPASATGTWPRGIRVDVRRDRPLPVFNQSTVSFKGTNLGYRWHSFDGKETKDRMEATIDWAGTEPGRGRITFRRLQRFEVKEGGSYHWEIQSLQEKGKVLQSGDVTAEADKALSSPQVTVPTQPARLIVTAK
jgi:hypothetical protein